MSISKIPRPFLYWQDKQKGNALLVHQHETFTRVSNRPQTSWLSDDFLISINVLSDAESEKKFLNRPIYPAIKLQVAKRTSSCVPRWKACEGDYQQLRTRTIPTYNLRRYYSLHYIFPLFFRLSENSKEKRSFSLSCHFCDFFWRNENGTNSPVSHDILFILRINTYDSRNMRTIADGAFWFSLSQTFVLNTRTL